MVLAEDDYYLSDDYTVESNNIHNSEIFSMIVGSISALFPLSVVIILIQRYDTLVRGKSLIHYVLMIAIGDTLSALMIALGFPRGLSHLCSAQGFILVFCSRMSWFFTDVLIIQLFFVVVFQRYFLNVKSMHYIVWSLNILMQFLPYSTKTNYGGVGPRHFTSCGLAYGKNKTKAHISSYIIYHQNSKTSHIINIIIHSNNNNDNNNNYYNNHDTGKGTKDSYYEWTNFAYNIWLMISISLIIVLTIFIVFYSLTVKSSQVLNPYLAHRIRDSWSVVILYPLAMLLAWTPVTSFSYYFIYALDKHKSIPYFRMIVTLNYLFACSAVYGPLLSLIFYTKTIDARRAWMHNLKCILNLVYHIEIDDRSTCSSIISVEDRYVSELVKPSGTNKILRLTKESLQTLGLSNQKVIKSNRIDQQVQISPMMHTNDNDNINRIEEGL